MGKRKITRIRSKIDDLPAEIRTRVDEMLVDIRNTYGDIAAYLQEAGYAISKSAVGRYALRTNNATQRLIEAQEQTKALIDVIRKNPEVDYTEGALQIMTGELTKKMAAAEEDWDAMPLDKAARIMVQLSRTKVYKDKVRADLTTKAQIAVEGLKAEFYAELQDEDPELCAKLIEAVNRFSERLQED